MSKEKLERNENEELKKTINPEPEVSDLQESESGLQKEDSAEAIAKEEAEEKAEEATEEKTEEKAEEVHEDELMEVPSSSGGKWLVAIFIAVIIAVIIGVVIIIMCRPKEKEPEPIAAVEQVQEEPKEEVVEVVVESEPVEEEVVTEEVESTEETTAEETADGEVEEETTITPVTYDGIDMESTLPGVEWIETTFPGIIDTPKLVIFNDTTNRKTIVEEGQKVEFHKDDVLAIYSPEGMSTISQYDYKCFDEAYLHIAVMELKKVPDCYWDSGERETENIVGCNGQLYTLTCLLEFEE